MQIENIIRRYLTEQLKPLTVIEPAKMDSRGETWMTGVLAPKLGLKANQVSVSDFYGLNLDIKRRGKINGEDAPLYTPEQQQSDVVNYMKSQLAGMFAQRKREGWYWFISGDLTDKAGKQEKNRAKFRVTASYIKADLLKTRKKISSSTAGFIAQFSQGAYIFDADKINPAEWERAKTPGNPAVPKKETGVDIGGDGSKLPPLPDQEPLKADPVALSKITVPVGGFKAGNKYGADFYEVQKAMLAALEPGTKNLKLVTVIDAYNELKSGLGNSVNHGDYWLKPKPKKTGEKLLGGTQQAVSALKNGWKWPDRDPNTVDQEFVNKLLGK